MLMHTGNFRFGRRGRWAVAVVAAGAALTPAVLLPGAEAAGAQAVVRPKPPAHPPQSAWGRAYSFTPLLQAAGMPSGTYLTPTTTVVIYNNTGHTLQLSRSHIAGNTPSWSTGNGVDGEYPYGVPPKSIAAGASGRIQMINSSGGGVGGGVNYYAKDGNLTYFAGLDFDNWNWQKNKYTVELVTWKYRGGHGTPDGDKLRVNLIDDEGRKVTTNDRKRLWNSDTIGKGMAPVIGMVINDPYGSSTYPELGSRPDAKAKACENYRKLARQYGAKRKSLEKMWTDGRIGAIAGAWIGMAFKCVDW
ncbi:hypothetical protein CP973_21725 [Streptomyces albofaciens JCM 4342]|uniref:hypothetical protein n=1 Tax=Streptomyces albofaciens TaxID=66866 RepID=UPI00123AC9F0|nr:hypothetical protein [Streptomyces albofaciens]KAA6212092.1 hypothetical protein CP973_21725 [Streptomyces albofaciens JCM 4342]